MIVFGYIRNIQQFLLKNTFINIPRNVSIIILAFYAEFSDEFDKKLCGKGIKISNDNKQISGAPKWRTCYGKNIISSINNGIYIWKLKMLGTDNYAYIDIDNVNGPHINTSFHDTNQKAFYAYNPYLGFFLSWNKRYNKADLPQLHTNDILTMKLQFDTDKETLSIKKNDDKEIIAAAYVTREKELDYRFAISTCRPDKEVSIRILNKNNIISCNLDHLNFYIISILKFQD